MVTVILGLILGVGGLVLLCVLVGKLIVLIKFLIPIVIMVLIIMMLKRRKSTRSIRDIRQAMFESKAISKEHQEDMQSLKSNHFQ